MVRVQNLRNAGAAGQDVNVVAFFLGQKLGFSNLAVWRTVSADVRWDFRVEGCFASVVHEFSGAVRQKQRPSFCLNESFSFYEVSGLYIYEIFEESHGIRQVETCCLLNLELPYDFLDGFADPSVHTPFVGRSCHLGEEETRNP